MPRKNRNYGKGESHSEYDYHSSPEQKANRAARNKARREAIAEGKVQKGDRSKEVDHKKPLSKGGSKSTSNTRVTSRDANRKKYNKG